MKLFSLLKSFPRFTSFVTLVILLVAFGVILTFSRQAPETKKAEASVNSNGRGFFFGSNAHFESYDVATQNAVITAATQAKFSMLRGGDTFANIAPTSANTSTWNWSKMDAFVTKTSNARITPLINLYYNVPWLTANTLNSNETLANKNAFIKAFGDYAFEVASRYKPGNASGFPVVTYYNVWNEPSLPQFFNWGADEFARLIAEASYRIKQANPSAVVGFDVHAVDHMYSYNYTAENQTGTVFIPRVLSKTVTLQYNSQAIEVIDYVDLLTTHTYPDRTSDIPEDVLGKEVSTPFTDFNNYLTHSYQGVAGQRYGYGPVRGAKRLLVGENGWYSCSSGTPGHYVSETKQAALIVRTLLNLASNPVIEGYLQYDMKDDGTGTGCINTNGESEFYYGLTRYNLVNNELDPKPSFIAYKTAIATLDGTNSVDKQITTIDASRKLYNYRFESSDGKKVVWALVRANAATPFGNLDMTTSPMTIQVDTPTVLRVNLDGSNQVLTANNGSVSVNVSENPVFIVRSLSTPIPTATPTSQPVTPTPTPDLALSPIVTTIYNPVNGIIYAPNTSGFNMQSSASYNGGTVNGIKVFLDGVLKKNCSWVTSSCDAYISLAGVGNGVHTLSVEAYVAGVTPNGYDAITLCKGSCSSLPTPTPTTAPVATPTPTITPVQGGSSFIVITAPRDGAVLTAGGSIVASPIPNHNGNLQNVKIYVDNVQKAACNYATNACSVWLNLTTGQHTIYATGYEKTNPTTMSTSPVITVTRQ